MKVSYSYDSDHLGDVIGALSGNRMIGGLSFHSSHTQKDGRLPLERLGISLFSQLGLSKSDKVAQVTALGIDLSFKDKASIARELFKTSIARSLDVGCDYLVIWASKVHSRLYKQLFFSLGFDLVTRSDLKLPCPEGLEGHKMTLSVLDLRSAPPLK
jgi:hypothetical protein